MAALILLGLAILAVTIVDVVWTTFAAGSGAGPVTSRIADAAWRGALALHARRPGHRALSAAGVAVAASVLVLWTALALVGWTLVFASAEGAVREPSGVPASLSGRVYFVGFSVFTLGLGDLQPGEGWWRIATAVMSGTGLVLVTLTITFLLPVVSAVSARRQFANHVSSLGRSPTDLLTRAWSGSGFGSLSQHLTDLTPVVESLRQQRLAYPVVRYFHSVERDAALGPAVVTLTEALHLLDAVDPDARPDPAATRPLLAALDGLLAGVPPRAGDEVPAPDVQALIALDIPLVADAVPPSTDVEERRARVVGLLVDEGWDDELVRPRG
ncbi:ion channel [Actinomarinicola tropica]|uniref:Two pore domain potassium channel family protein n=1 Tax=Actinomarinicola tropica TaxID=2789776 RepID=A0A5Q2RP33_9ACTN|nr:ion channel [Actinomarinicola tropica]QGG96351.1 two pore domain potassium channel family protein [Actinomarinicola tropica]